MKIVMPSQKKFYDLGGGWFMKETPEGARGLYPQSHFIKKPWYDALLNRRGMATVYSDDWTKVRAGRRVGPNVMTGNMGYLYWDFASLPAGNIGDVLVCGKIYKGDRVIGGRECHGALSSAGGTATGSYGTYAVLSDGVSLGAVDDADEFLAATDFEAAGANVLAPTIALSFGYVAASDLFLVCVNSVEAFATAGRVTGVLNLART